MLDKWRRAVPTRWHPPKSTACVIVIRTRDNARGLFPAKHDGHRRRYLKISTICMFVFVHTFVLHSGRIIMCDRGRQQTANLVIEQVEKGASYIAQRISSGEGEEGEGVRCQAGAVCRHCVWQSFDMWEKERERGGREGVKIGKTKQKSSVVEKSIINVASVTAGVTMAP